MKLMTLPEFVRLYPLRAKNIAWFFGAGTSVAAGMPSANDLVWEFKRKIYCSEQGYNLSLFNNLSDIAIRSQIQSYFDNKASYPVSNSVDEYSFYFEKAYPFARDRSDYLMEQLHGMKNSFGHKVLGVLMKNALVKLIFTTNFDKAFENAAIEELKTMDKFFVASIDNTTTAVQRYKSGFSPFIAKIHGDYFSEKLKNTTDELRTQDNNLRDILYHSCLSNGLAIMGYSGRDTSIMEIFNKALDESNSFPNGIFWFVRPGSNPLPEVTDFLTRANKKGIQACLIEIETFDNAWAEIIKGIEKLPQEDSSKLNENYFKLSNIPLPSKGTKYPLVRFNAVTITEYPTSTRLIKCDAGNTKAINELITQQKSDIIAIRKQSGIVGFGADSEFDRVFSVYGNLTKDVFQIPDATLNHDDSTLKGLLTEGLLRSIVRDKPLLYRKRRDRHLIIPDPKKLDEASFNNLKKEFDQMIMGVIPKVGIQWILAVEISLQKKMSNYFMVLSPTVLAGKSKNESERLQIAPFIKEAMAEWYNSKYARILDIWLDIIFLGKKEIKITLFEESIQGFNAHYKLKREAPHSKTI